MFITCPQRQVLGRLTGENKNMPQLMNPSRGRSRLYLSALMLLLAAACSEAPQVETPDPPTVSGTVGAGTTTGNGQSGPGGGMAAPPTDGYNNHNISRNEYTVDPGFISEGLLVPGDGLDMSEPGSPKRRAGGQPLDLILPKRMTSATEDYTLTESFRLVEATSASSEAKILSAYFQGSYGFVSGEAALDQAREERSNSRSIYAVLEAKGQVQDIQTYLGGKPIAWRSDAKPMLEGSDVDDATFRRQFLLDYGSHYVSAITYGYRVAIRGKMTKADSSLETKVKAAFKAAFVSGSAEGGISADDRKTLSSSNLELVFAATSGGLYEGEERRPGILTNLDDIMQMLNDMKSGRIKIHAAPLSATARNYWNLLPADYTRSRALLADHGEAPLPEPFFGVPKGTIISWNPPASAVRADNAGNRHIIPPPGWALCNGEDGTPDLRDRFVRGTADPAALARLAGSADHGHPKVNSSKPSPVEKHGAGGSSVNYAMGNHVHTVAIAAAAVDPPHVKLAYIMKQ